MLNNPCPAPESVGRCLSPGSVSAKVLTSENCDLLAAIEKVALRRRDEVHLYLKFIGDGLLIVVRVPDGTNVDQPRRGPLPAQMLRPGLQCSLYDLCAL